jgi:hypothetical protein
MSNYPKALEEFLKGDGAPYKEVIDETFSTDAGKRILEGVGDRLNSIKLVDNTEQGMQDQYGDCGGNYKDNYDDCPDEKYDIKLNIDTTKGDPYLLGFVLAHEMEHINQFNRLGFEYRTKSGELMIEPDSDSRALSCALQAKHHEKSPEGYGKILDSLGVRGYNINELKGLEKLPDNMVEKESYEILKYNFARNKDNFYQSKDDLHPRLKEFILEKCPDFKGKSNKDFYIDYLQKESNFRVIEKEKAEEEIFRDDINKNPNLIGNDKDNYPIALRALLNRSDVPKENKDKFEEFAQTELGRKKIKGILSLDRIRLIESDEANNSVEFNGGAKSINFSGSLLEKSPELFVEVLSSGFDDFIEKENPTRTPLSKEEVVIKKQENKSKRDIEQAKINNEGRRTALNRFKNGVREEERVNNPLLKARKHGRE